jgi:Collagen triple helix repeat (20 copies)
MTLYDPTRLYSALLNTGLQQKNNPLYQVIYDLIGAVAGINKQANTTASGGNPGPQGIQGKMGLPGVDGIDGEDAPVIQGATGATGSQGSQGFQGIPGLDGSDGDDSVLIGIPTVSLVPIPYTPVLTNITIGNGTFTGLYLQIGKLVIWKIVMTFGSTTSISSLPEFTLPVPAFSTDATSSGTYGYGVHQASGTSYDISIVSVTTTVVGIIYTLGATDANTPITTTAPFIWAATDTIQLGGSYMAA